jgi:hypothetical protein
MTQDHYRSFFGDYMLSCRPLPLDDGSFQARVVITSLGGAKTRSQRFLDLEIFASHDEAVEHARRAGVDWIMRNDPAASAFNPSAANRASSADRSS